MNWELYYKDETGEYIIGNCTTNHSISVDDALRITETDMDEWADERAGMVGIGIVLILDWFNKNKLSLPLMGGVDWK